MQNFFLDDLYLKPDEAQQKLLLSGSHTLETLPTLETLRFFLADIQISMDNWLGWSLLPTEYTEILLANWQGILTTYRYPVIEVRSVLAICPTVLGQPLRKLHVMATVQGTRTIAVGGGKRYEVTYIAGYEQIPEIVKSTMFRILQKVMLEDIDLGDRTRYLSSVGLQGGISQSFQLGSEPKSLSSSRNIDDLMLPLYKFKRRIID